MNHPLSAGTKVKLTGNISGNDTYPAGTEGVVIGFDPNYAWLYYVQLKDESVAVPSDQLELG